MIIELKGVIELKRDIKPNRNIELEKDIEPEIDAMLEKVIKLKRDTVKIQNVISDKCPVIPSNLTIQTEACFLLEQLLGWTVAKA